jgi:hypothetical protein
MSRYYFKKEKELTPDEITKLGQLTEELKALNLGRGTWMEWGFGVGSSGSTAENFFKFEYHYMYDDGDYFFRYYSLNQDTGEVTHKPHGDPRINEYLLTVTPELEARIIAFLKSITKTRAFNIRKHALLGYAKAHGRTRRGGGGNRLRRRKATRRRKH